MITRALRQWTDLVDLHPDVEGGALTEVVFAIDLGAIAASDPNAPVVNRNPESFFRREVPEDKPLKENSPARNRSIQVVKWSRKG